MSCTRLLPPSRLIKIFYINIKNKKSYFNYFRYKVSQKKIILFFLNKTSDQTVNTQRGSSCVWAWYLCGLYFLHLNII